MKMGYSGAVIKPCSTGIMKVAPKGTLLLQQARQCENLYPLTPKVTGTWCTENEDGYIMEKLEEPEEPRYGDHSLWVLGTLARMRAMLHGEAWAKPLRQSDSWVDLMNTWIGRIAPSYLITKLQWMLHTYFEDKLVSGCTIHGDPTLANVLYRKNGDLVISDPIPPVGKMPSHYTVDLGKLLQSAIGWETLLYDWRYNKDTAIASVLRTYSKPVQAKAWFWCAIHCLRILPYSLEKRIEQWAITNAEYATNRAKEYECYMPSISTAPSLTQSRLS
jgi:hypothetical protein